MTAANTDWDGQPIGMLNIDKPSGMTSHDVVAMLRKVVGIRRIGHAGTLDPLATGVLLVCVGRATRLAEYLVAETKEYLATVRLGQTTDTYDADGKLEAVGDCSGVSRDMVERALEPFTGLIKQVPPTYAALKHNGVPLYRLARQGQVVDRAPRAVEIQQLELTSWTPPRFGLRIRCSKGTYVRSLAHDLGQALGCGAHLSALRRLAVGRFTVHDAVPLDELTSEDARGAWREHLLPPQRALASMPRVHVQADAIRKIAMGQVIACDAPAPDGHILALDADDRLVAVLCPTGEGDLCQPRKVFVQPDP